MKSSSCVGSHLLPYFLIVFIPIFFSVAVSAQAEPSIEVKFAQQEVSTGLFSTSEDLGTEFSDVAINSGGITRTFTIENTGDEDLVFSSTPIVRLTIGGVSPEIGALFVSSQPDGVVSPGGTTSFDLTFNPTIEGRTSAVLSIDSNASSTAYFFVVGGAGVKIASEASLLGNGHGIESGDDSPNTLDGTNFGEINIDAPAPADRSVSRTFTISNTGGEPLELTGSPIIALNVLSGAADVFELSAEPVSPIAPGGSSDFELTFSPKERGEYLVEVVIVNSDIDQTPLTFHIAGSAIADLLPDIEVGTIDNLVIENGDDTPSISEETDFGEVVVGSGGVSHLFTLSNVGEIEFDRAAGILFLSGDPLVEIVPSILGVDPQGESFFSVSAQPTLSSFPTGSAAIFEVTFTPQFEGLFQADVRILSNDPDEAEYLFLIQGVGVFPPEPEINILGNDLTIPSLSTEVSITNGTDFEVVQIGSAAVEQSFVIENTGDAELELLSASVVEIALLGDNAQDVENPFTVSLLPSASIASGAISVFEIAFQPQEEASYRAEVTVLNNDSDEASYTFEIAGEGKNPAVSEIEIRSGEVLIVNGDDTPSEEEGNDFLEVVLGADFSRSNIFSVHSVGEAELILEAEFIEISGPHMEDFSFELLSEPLEEDIIVRFSITFNPQVAGLRTALVSVFSNASDNNPYQFTVQGTGLPPEPEINILGNDLTIPSLSTEVSITNGTDFEVVQIGSAAVEQSFVIENTGDAELELLSASVVEIALLGDNAQDVENPFTVSLLPSASIASGAISVFEIAFQPQEEASYRAEVTVLNNDSDEASYTFEIAGEGKNPAVSEIEIRSGEVLIVNGDDTPSEEEGNDFLEVVLGADFSRSNIFSVHSVGEAELILEAEFVEISGPHMEDFSFELLSEPLEEDIIVRFSITFNPQVAGLRTALISVFSNASDNNPYQFTVQGTGLPMELILDMDEDGLSDQEEIELGTDMGVADTDGDGVEDGQEIIDTSDPLDAGSYLFRLRNNFCAEWNGFLGMMHNIVEFTNFSLDTRDVSTKLYNVGGAEMDNMQIVLPSGIQFDVLAHDLSGWQRDNTGVICSDVSAGIGSRSLAVAGDTDGRMMHYRPNGEGGYDFVLAMPFDNPIKGDVVVQCNTLFPSGKISELGNLVSNWFTIVNASDSMQRGEVRFYNQAGEQIHSESHIIPANGRQDIDFHRLGLSQVGLIKWLPLDKSASFRSTLNRYFYSGASFEDEVVEAVSLKSYKGTRQELYVPLDTREDNATIEISNVSDGPNSVQVFVTNGAGEALHSTVLELVSNQTEHIVINEVLPGDIGLVRIVSSAAVVATGMQYGRDEGGALKYLYSIPASENIGAVVRGSYNTFLNQGCRLYIGNADLSEQEVTVDAVRYDGEKVVSGRVFTIAGRGAVEFDICSEDEDDTYGVVTVQPAIANSVTAYIVRRGENDSYRVSLPLR